MKKLNKIFAILILIIPFVLIYKTSKHEEKTLKESFTLMRKLDLKKKTEEVCSKISDNFYNYDIPEEDKILYINKSSDQKISDLIDMIETNSFTKNKFYHKYLLKLNNYKGFLVLFSIFLLIFLISYIFLIGYYCFVNTYCSQNCCKSCLDCFCAKENTENQIKRCLISIIFWFIIPLILLGVITHKYKQKENILSDVECSFLKFIDDIYEGENDSNKNSSKWPGVGTVYQKLNEIVNKVEELNKSDILINLENLKNNIDNKKEDFENELILKSKNITSDSNYYFNKDLHNNKLDLADEFYLSGSNLYDSYSGTLINKWYYEYNYDTGFPISNIHNTFNYFDELRKYHNINGLLSASYNILNMMDNLLPVKNEINDIIVDNLIQTNNSILLGLNCTQIFSIIFSIIFATFWVLIIIFYGNQYTEEELRKRLNIITYFYFVMNIILSILSLLLIFVGFTLLIVGNIGTDFYKAISYLVNITNYNSTIFGNSSNILNICINGNGDIKKEIGLTYDNSYIFEQVKWLKKSLEENYIEIIRIKNSTPTYYEISDILNKRANYEDIDFGNKYYTGWPYRITLKVKLQELNDKTSNINEEWNFNYDNSTSCLPYESHSNKLYFNPKTCNPSFRYQNISYLEDVSNYISEFIRMQNYANGDSDNSIKVIIEDVRRKYIEFLDELSKGIDFYIDAIENVSNITEGLIEIDNNYFTFLNCSFIGTDVKIILKALRISVGKKFNKKSVGMIFAALFFVFIICLVHYLYSPLLLLRKVYNIREKLKQFQMFYNILRLLNILENNN